MMKYNLPILFFCLICFLGCTFQKDKEIVEVSPIEHDFKLLGKIFSSGDFNLDSISSNYSIEPTMKIYPDGIFRLGLEAYGFKTFPKEINSFSNLGTFSIARNFISHIDSLKLESLGSLRIGANKFTKIPNVSNCINLTSLSISFNELKDTIVIDNELNDKLRSLDLNNNKIKQIYFKKVQPITFLELEYNQLTSINETFKNLPNLNRLDIGGNPIDTIDCNYLPQDIKVTITNNNDTSLVLLNNKGNVSIYYNYFDRSKAIPNPNFGNGDYIKNGYFKELEKGVYKWIYPAQVDTAK